MANATGLDRLVERCRETGVVRPSDRRWVAGVCVGLAVHRRIDPVLLRVGFILLTVFGGIGIALYLVCWLLLPAADASVALDRALRGGDGGAITLLVLTVLITLGSFMSEGPDHTPTSVLGIVVVGGILWWLARTGRLSGPRTRADATGTPAPAGPDGHRAGRVAHSYAAPSPAWDAPWQPAPVQDGVPARPLPPGSTAAVTTSAVVDPAVRAEERRRRGTSSSITLLTAGLALLAYLWAGGVLVGVPVERPWITGLAASLGVLGVALVITAFTGHRVLLLRLMTWILGLSLVFGLPTYESDAGHVEVWRPTTAADLRSAYESGVGPATLDLTAVPVDGTRRVRVSQGVGQLTVLVPTGSRTRITGDKGPGAVRVEENGRSREISPGLRDIVPVTLGTGPLAYDLDIEGGVGEVVVRVVTPTHGKEAR